MKNLFILFVALIPFSFSKGDELFTAQSPDRIKYRGIEYSLHANPLEPYFEKHPEKRPNWPSTALYRGYIGHFEIIEDQLFVTDITVPRLYKDANGERKIKSISIYKRIFPDTERVKIDWYSGILIVPYGKLVEYVHSGYASVYSNYILLGIKEGDFQQSKNYTYKEFLRFKKRQFSEFKKTEAYKKEFDNIQKNYPKSHKKFIESFLEGYITNYTSEFLVD